MWPKFYKIKQVYDQPVIKDIQAKVESELEYLLKDQNLPRGANVAITAGSRGISNIVLVLQTVVRKVKEYGYHPFIFAAMGSHGGGTEEGQRDILQSLGVTEESMGCPIIAETNLVELGVTTEGLTGLPVYTTKEAYEADAVILVNRVKAHTSFVGPYESGLVKMMAVGMGRAKGASMVHRLGAEKLAESMPSIAKVVLEKTPVVGGIALVENSLEQTAIIKGIKKADIFAEEKKLLIESKGYLPKLPVRELDFGVVKEMGKNFSGTGMDTNVIGRVRIEGISEPTETNIRYLAVLDLSEESHGNANGIGLADFTTERYVNKIDKKSTYLNCVTSGFVIRAAIPMTFKDDEDLFENVYQVIRPDDGSTLRVAIIENTLHVDKLWVSEVVYEELKDREEIELLEGPLNLEFKQGILAL